MGCVQSYFRKAHNAGLSPSSTHGSEKAGIPQDATADVADLIEHPEKEPLDVNDIQNEDEVIQTEKTNEPTPEPNGTIKRDSSDAVKLVAATVGTAAVAGTLAAVAASTDQVNSENKVVEDVHIASQVSEANASPAPAEAETTNEISENAKSPETIDESDGVIIEAATRPESAESAKGESTPGQEDANLEESVPKSAENPPSESVPEDRPSTARSEELEEQGSRPASASDVVQDVDGISRPSTGNANEEEGTRPISASSAKQEEVPDISVEDNIGPSSVKDDTSRPQTSTELIAEPQNSSRPGSTADSTKVDSRPASSVEHANETANAPSVETEILESNKDAEETSTSRPDSKMAGTKTEESRPSSETDDQKQVIPTTMGTEIAQESIENETPIAVERNIQSRGVEESSRPTSTIAENEAAPENRVLTDEKSPEEANSRPVSVIEQNTQDVEQATEENASNSAKENSQPTSRAESVKETESRPTSTIDKEEELRTGSPGSRPISSSELKEEVSSAGSAMEENKEKDNELLERRPVSEAEGVRSVEVSESVNKLETQQDNEFESTKEVGSKPTSPVAEILETIEQSNSRPASVSESTKEVGNRPATAEADINEVDQQVSSRPLSVSESGKQEESRPSSALLDTAISSEEQMASRPPSAVVESVEISEQKPSSRPVSAVESTKGEGGRPVSVGEAPEEQSASRPVSVSESTKKEESRPSSAVVDNADSKEEQSSRPVSIAESNKGEGSRPASVVQVVEESPVSRPVSVSESTKEKVSRPSSAVEEIVEATEEQSVSRPVSTSESAKQEASRPSSVLVENVEAVAENSESQNKDDSETTKVESRPSSIVVGNETTEEQSTSRPISVSESAKEESRPTSAVAQNLEGSDDQSIKHAASVTESTNEEESGPASSEVIASELVREAESANEEGSRPASEVIDTTADEQPKSRPDSTSDSNKEERATSVASVGSRTNDQTGSRPPSAIVENSEFVSEQSSQKAVSNSEAGGEAESGTANLANDETIISRPASEGGSVTEEKSRPASSAVETEAAEIQLSSDIQLTKEDTRPASASESIKGDDVQVDSRPVTAVEANANSSDAPELLTVQDGIETPEVDVDDVKNIEAEQEAAETTSPGVAGEAKETSRPSSSIQEGTEDERSAIEAESGSVPASVSVSAEPEVIDEGESKQEEGGETSSIVEEIAEPSSIPSLTITEASGQPESDEVQEPTEEEKPEDKSTEEEGKQSSPGGNADALNNAATTIQAGFRGFQTRQALSKAAEFSQVQPASATPHDFLFGPPVEEAASSILEQEAADDELSVRSTPRSPETGEKQQDLDNDLAELQKPEECDDLPAPPDDIDLETDPDSSVSTAATKIQAGVRGFLTRRQVQQMKTSNSTTAPSIGDSQQSIGDTLTSQETEDEGVQTSGSLETEVQKQSQVTLDGEEVPEPQEVTSIEEAEVQKGRSLDSQLNGMVAKAPIVRSAVSLHDGPVNEDEDREVWETLQQDAMNVAATKIQSNFRGFRTRRSLRREDAVQMPTTSTSTSTATASSEVTTELIRHSGEFHDMVVLPPSPQEDATDASMSASGPIQ